MKRYMVVKEVKLIAVDQYMLRDNLYALTHAISTENLSWSIRKVAEEKVRQIILNLRTY
jgi:hypothetical protein